MLNFCKKMFFFYSFLGFSHSSDDDDDQLHRIRGKISSPDNCCSGLSLIAGEGEEDCRRPSNVLECASVKPKSVNTTKEEDDNDEKEKKVISNSFGFCSFLDEQHHGCMDGLSSCTESLGFESSDQMEEEEEEEEELRSKSVVRLSWRRTLLLERVKNRDELMKNQIKKFPPPLSTLNQNGKPNFFLKPVRKDGRLELTEVWIDRPNEILRASRQDGRLRLHLIVPEIEEEDEEEEEEETEEEDEVEVEVVEEEEVIKESEIRELKFPLTSVGDGFRWCQEIGNRHQRNHYHHHLPIWKQHEVTTRSTVHVL